MDLVARHTALSFRIRQLDAGDYTTSAALPKMRSSQAERQNFTFNDKWVL
jgi:hypothetical protein